MSGQYSIACRELGGECDFVARAATPTDAKRGFWRHLQQDHTAITSKLTPGMRVELERQMDGLLDGGVRGTARH